MAGRCTKTARFERVNGTSLSESEMSLRTSTILGFGISLDERELSVSRDLIPRNSRRFSLTYEVCQENRRTILLSSRLFFCYTFFCKIIDAIIFILIK